MGILFVCIIDCIPNTCNMKEWIIKVVRRNYKEKTDNVLEIKYRDLVEYTYKNAETHRGYVVTARYLELLALNFHSPAKHCKKVKALS